jgi:transcriptional regulator with XRE-family HTH domain
MNSNTYKQRLKELRKAAGLTQKELSDLSEVSFGTLVWYENHGGSKNYLYKHLIRTCEDKIRDNQKLLGGS